MPRPESAITDGSGMPTTSNPPSLSETPVAFGKTEVPTEVTIVNGWNDHGPSLVTLNLG
jgi:hypothetical protein